MAEYRGIDPSRLAREVSSARNDVNKVGRVLTSYIQALAEDLEAAYRRIEALESKATD